MAVLRGRRSRCAECQRLVDFMVDYWPNGYCRSPRLRVCEPCAENLGVIDPCQEWSLP